MKKKKLLEKLKNESLKGNDVLILYNSLSSSERSYVDAEFEYRLEDDIRDRVEEDFDYNNVSVDDLMTYKAEELYEELHWRYGKESVIVAENLYDEDKLEILKKAFDVYNLDQLIEKLEITQMEAM